MSNQSSRLSLLTELSAVPSDFNAALPCYTTQTGDVTVTVRCFWLEEHSQPEDQHYAWLYHVTIENNGPHRLQLLSRTWTIINAYGHREEIHGMGVIGEQPILPPNTSFGYSSGAELKTPTGFMTGQYHMIILNSTPSKKLLPFSVDIPVFSLDCPHHRGLIH